MTATLVPATDAQLADALRAGDEAAFEVLIDRHGAAMLRLARSYCRSEAVAQEVVQETWLAVLTAVHRFEGRASLSTWLFQILSNRARTRGAREARTIPLSAFETPEAECGTVAADRFLADDHHRWPGHWAAPPCRWELPPDRLLSLEARGRLRAALEELPESQRLVVALRDVEGLDTDEVAETLELTPGNVRVLLHRGRAKLRQALEDYVDEV